MILDGNSKVGEAEVFATPREMNQARRIKVLEAKNLKLKQLMLLTDPVVGHVVMNEVTMAQWQEFIKCFPDEGGTHVS